MKTKEEIQKAVEILTNHNKWRRGEDFATPDNPKVIGKAIDTVLEAILEQGKWVSVETELPPAFCDVLCYSPLFTIPRVGFYDSDFKRMTVPSVNNRKPTVTHWQPIPPPPTKP